MEPLVSAKLQPDHLTEIGSELHDFDRVVQVYWPVILRFVLASVRDRDLAQTLTQDCFWNAYRSRNAFRGDSSLRTWLMKIAVNSVRKSMRNRRLQFWKQVQQSAIDATVIKDSMHDHRISPEREALVHEQIQAVWAVTENLSARQRTVFLLRFMEDLTSAEIAEVTGLSENTVNVHLFRALRVVRQRFDEDLR